MGRPSSNNMAATATASCNVSQNACQSIAMVAYSSGTLALFPGSLVSSVVQSFNHRGHRGHGGYLRQREPVLAQQVARLLDVLGECRCFVLVLRVRQYDHALR